MAVLSTYSATTAAPESTETTQTTTDTSTTTVDTNGTLNADQQNNNNAATTDTATTTDTTTQTATTEPDETIVDFSLDSTAATTDTTTTQSTTTQPAATTAAQPSFNLDDEIKKVDRKELLKKIGVPDFVIEMDSHIAGGGQPVDYLNARATNYDNISDEEIVKADFRKKYQGWDDKEITRMYNRKYGVNDNMSEDEIQDVQLELKAEAYALRQTLKAEQQKFKIADNVQSPQSNEAFEQWKQTNEENQRLIGQLNEFYNGHAATKSLNESKRVTISFGEGVKPLNFNIDKPELITNAMLDGGLTIAQRSLNEKGEPDVARQQLGAFLALDPHKILQQVFNYGKSVGARGKVAEGQNAGKPNTSAGGQPEAKTTYSTGTYGGGGKN